MKFEKYLITEKVGYNKKGDKIKYKNQRAVILKKYDIDGPGQPLTVFDVKLDSGKIIKKVSNTDIINMED